MWPVLLLAGLTGWQPDIVREINELRANPPGYAAHLQARLKHFRGNVLRLPGTPGLQTREGAKAVNEAIRALRETKPLPPLRAVEGLMQAAEDHVRDTGPKGLLTHEGTDGATLRDRVRRYAAQFGYLGENISYGPDDVRSVVVDLLIDDGVKGRGHRKILLDGQYGFAGAACGPHAIYRTMCVIDFAGKWDERERNRRP